MRTLATFGLLILVASMALGGMTSNVSAEDNSAILLKIAKRTQEQIDNQISSDSSDKIKRLFEEGSQKVTDLEIALESNKIDLAKKHFLSAMKIFKEISRHLATSDTVSDVASQAESTVRDTVKDPSNDLQRLHGYVNSLKTIAKKHNAEIDFSDLNKLFAKAREQIGERKFTAAFETIHDIKEIIIQINKELRQEASKQESERAKEYSQKYLEQLDRLIENAKKQGLDDEIIEKLETAKKNLSLAENPKDIVKEIRKIISIKDQFELTKNDRLESRVLQVEKIIDALEKVDGVEQGDLSDARKTIVLIKDHLSKGEFDTANGILRDLAIQLQEIKNSL